ncbi:MAG: sugar phosphate isomerase/epimerase [Hyphomicrobiales bacterium]
MPHRLSFQLYSARNFPPLKDTLALLASAGYREVEGYGGVYDNPPALRRLLDRNGLVMPTGHFGLDLLEGERDTVLDIVRTLGIRQIYAPWLDPKDRPRSAAGYRRFGRRLARIGAWARGEGLGFGWHNHDFEFAKLSTGEVPLDLIFESAPMIDWECDVAWVARAGVNPLPWIKKYGGRITAVHVKDIAAKGMNLDEDGWCDVGDGTVKWPAILAALDNSRCMHRIMEHDNPKDLARFARRSFASVSKL